MESLNGATTQPENNERSKEWVTVVDTVLEVLGGFFLVNGVYFALFTTSIFTAVVYYSFVLMVLIGIGYTYYFTAEDVEDLLYTWQVAGRSVVRYRTLAAAGVAVLLRTWETADLSVMDSPDRRARSTPEPRRL